LIEEALVGTALILALALRGVWCLHASAVAVDGQAVALLGESGYGKSTLAAYLASDPDLPWRRAGDDVLPVAMTQAGLVALPHFPQLKLAPDAQPAAGLPQSLPLQAVYVLAGPAQGSGGVAVEPLGTAEASLALVRHTVAARLFDRELLAQHLGFCAGASASLPLHRMFYPHRWDVLPQVREAIARDLAHLG